MTAGDPRLGPLADNGGNTPSMALLWTGTAGAAIDAGYQSGCTDFDNNAITTDQHDVSRPQGTRCDVGAFEFRHNVVTGVGVRNSGLTNLGRMTVFTATTSEGSNPTYAWSFGDGTVGSGAIVTHTYSELGVYTAIVTATKGSSSAVAATAVTVVEAPIVGLRAANSSPTKLSESTTFTATINSGSHVTYVWSFGDGSFGSGSNPTHTYAALGDYIATVTATNSANVAVATTRAAVMGEIPISGLEIDYSSPALANTVTWFTAAIQTGRNAAYVWDFGDLSPVAAITGTSISHVFANTGSYTVTVTARNDANTVSASLPITVTASPIFVRASATGSNNGASWANAYTSLQSALAPAGSGREIWVAKGTYTTTTGTDRTASFTLKNGVAIYGGFVGIENDRSARNWAQSETLLSGNIGALNSSTDNSQHVVVGSSRNATAVLDGFVIQGGYASYAGMSFSGEGGGIYIVNGSPTIRNVTLRGNYASAYGGGIYISSGSPTLMNLILSGNSAGQYGGGLYVVAGNVTLQNTVLAGNSAGWSGGAESLGYQNPTFKLRNVTMSGNGGGGIVASYGVLDVRNSVVWGNTGFDVSTSSGGLIAADEPGSADSAPAPRFGATITIGDSVIGSWSGTGSNIIRADPLFRRNPGTNGTSDYGDLRLKASSPAINSGDNATCLATDLDGNVRARTDADKCDMGAYEYQGGVVLNTVVGENENTGNLPIGSIVTYTIGLAGDVGTGDSLLTDLLPAGVEFESWVQQNGAEVSGSTITLGIPGGTTGTPVSVVFRARVKRDLSLVGSTQVNTARLLAESAGPLEAMSTFVVAGTVNRIYLPIVTGGPSSRAPAAGW